MCDYFYSLDPNVDVSSFKNDFCHDFDYRTIIMSFYVIISTLWVIILMFHLCHKFKVVSHNKVSFSCVFQALYRHSDKSLLSVSADDKLKE